jgi:predicted DNA-binding protein (MmcQ/YjbR family)
LRPDEVREFALNLPNATESFPFRPDLPVFKVSGKVFGILTAPGQPDPSITVKSDPEDARALCAQFGGISPGYHMSKKHWVTVVLDADVPSEVIEELVTASFDLVRPRRPRAPRAV